jgi:hypothetical protein
LYGTLFYHLNNKFFSIEDIFLYKGQDFSDHNYSNKLLKICLMLKNDIKQISYNSHFVVFGLPIISNTYEDLDKKITDIKYKINSIYYINPNKKNSFLVLPFNEYNKNCQEQTTELDCKTVLEYVPDINTKKSNKFSESSKIIGTYHKMDSQKFITKIFLCKPDIQNDIYHLYSLNNEYVGLACIPDYKTSKMMNTLFRIIKENNDLDKLEESDDEDEFENPNIDKFVFLNKSYKMECEYNKKFKKWVPINSC